MPEPSPEMGTQRELTLSRQTGWHATGIPIQRQLRQGPMGQKDTTMTRNAITVRIAGDYRDGCYGTSESIILSGRIRHVLTAVAAYADLDRSTPLVIRGNPVTEDGLPMVVAPADQHEDSRGFLAEVTDFFLETHVAWGQLHGSGGPYKIGLEYAILDSGAHCRVRRAVPRDRMVVSSPEFSEWREVVNDEWVPSQTTDRPYLALLDIGSAVWGPPIDIAPDALGARESGAVIDTPRGQLHV